jgi:hypothetical protein
VLADLGSALIEEELRATLAMLGKLTSQGTLSAADFASNTIDRVANAFAFEVLSQAGFEAGAKYLLRRGYR